MSNLQQLVYLRVTRYQVQGFTTLLPKNPADLTEIVLQGPYEIMNRSGNYHVSPFADIVPIYDGQREEILWACAGHSGSQWLGDLALMRIGPHLSLSSYEKTLAGSLRGKPMSVIQENSMIFISGGADPKDRSETMKGDCLAMKTQEGKWDWSKINTLRDEDSTSGLQSTLFQGLDTSMKYTYIISMPEGTASTNTVRYNEILSRQFRQLSPSADIFLWKSFELDIGYTSDGDCPVVPLITTSKAGDHRKLHLLRLNKADSCVHTAYVELRKDGSLHSTERKVTAKGHQRYGFQLTGTPQGLKLIHLGQRVVLLTFDDGRTPVASMATINDDGTLPGESGWRRLTMRYAKALEDNKNESDEFVTAAVVVPNNFIE